MMPIKRIPLPLVGLLFSVAVIGGCSTEHINEPWVGPEQRELLDGELERDPDMAEKLRDRLANGQADR